jgi:hypothetical protein
LPTTVVARRGFGASVAIARGVIALRHLHARSALVRSWVTVAAVFVVLLWR